MVVEETSIVVIVHKDTKGINVVEVRFFFVVAALDVVHGLGRTEDVADSVVHGVVEESGQMILVGSNVSGISIEAFSHLENAGRSSIFGPEISWNLWNGVDADSIEVKLRDEVLYPVLEVSADVIVLSVVIWESSKTAVLDGPLVAPVNVTVVVIVLRLVQRVNLAEIKADGSRVVGNNIDHHIDVTSMAFLHKLLKVILTSEVTVDLLPVASPVAVISTIEVINDGRDPDGIEAHTLDVVKLLDHSLVVTTAVVA